MMTNLLTTLLVFLMGFPFVPADADKDKKKRKDQYYKYEREDVSVFREEVDFVLPDPLPIQFAGDQPVVTMEPTDLTYQFSGGQKVVVEASPRLEALVARDRQLKRKIEMLPGYRVHVYAGTVRQQAWNAKRRAMSAFPDVPGYLDYSVPNYVVRLGDFLNREEAYIFLREARQFFPGAFLVSSDVKVPKPEVYGPVRD